MTDLLGFRPVDLGAAALVALVVLLVLRGQLVPRRQLEDLRTDKDRQIEDLRAERDTWRQAHTVSEEARREAQDQAGELLEMSRTAGYFFNALPQPSRSREVSADAGMDQQAAAPPT
ncbi:hypothetical protein NFX46_01870 [Streptomyces phaeoluteigriseus]|uniref:Cell division protein FtsB n=1 Tax=Streptomyces phaeoluteigriseus TaxID=114686 RepID=A0ABY4Z1A3_9ACTN|nr:hypothetical protein [Streptomyces phaeoluteigriseus]USQ82622.1 hypothetical protein NFX46_01870 [Streptomyces phaeoluteigriseus]